MVMLGSPRAILTMELRMLIGMAWWAARLVIHHLVRHFSLHRIFLAYVLKLLETSTAGDGPSQMGIACGSGIGNPLAASSIGET